MKYLSKLCPFFDSTIKAIEKPCQHDTLITASARILILHGPSMFAVKAKIMECYIIKPAQSLLMKHLVIGQR